MARSVHRTPTLQSGTWRPRRAAIERRQYRVLREGAGLVERRGARPRRRDRARRRRVPAGPGHQRRAGARAGRRLLRRDAEPEGTDPGRHADPARARRRSSGSTRRPGARGGAARPSHVQDRPPGRDRRPHRRALDPVADRAGRPRDGSARWPLWGRAPARPAAEHSFAERGRRRDASLVRDRPRASTAGLRASRRRAPRRAGSRRARSRSLRRRPRSLRIETRPPAATAPT